MVNALAFSGTSFVFSRLLDHGAKKRKRHDLVEEKLQMVRDKWNIDRMKCLDFINKKLREKNIWHISTMLMKQYIKGIYQQC